MTEQQADAIVSFAWRCASTAECQGAWLVYFAEPEIFITHPALVFALNSPSIYAEAVYITATISRFRAALAADKVVNRAVAYVGWELLERIEAHPHYAYKYRLV